jgi:hypothetical protein
MGTKARENSNNYSKENISKKWLNFLAKIDN